MAKIDQQKIQQRMTVFEAACRREGAKITHQRVEVFREVASCDDHPDAEMIFQRVKKRIPTISLDTVYRTLWFLKDLKLLTTLGSHRERTRFDANVDDHHHFVCTRCGATHDFYSETLDNLKLPKNMNSFGQIETTHVELRGICRACASKR